MKYTLAEIIRRKLEKSQELGEYADENPLQVQIGGHVSLDMVDYRDVFFFVRSLRILRETASGKTFSITDYDLATIGSTGETKEVRLRLVPVEDPDSQLKYDCLVLDKMYEATYRQAAQDGLYDAQWDGTGTAPAIQSPDGILMDRDEAYERRFGDLAAHRCTEIVLRDNDRDGTVRTDEVNKRSIQYWDYQSQADDGVFLFAEEDADGMFSLWKGPRIPQEAVTRV